MGAFSPAPRSCLDEPRERDARAGRPFVPVRRLGLVVLALAATALAAAVAASARTASGTVNVAVIAPFSGPASNLGKFISLSCYAAAEEISKGGGILGNDVQCSTIDDTGDPADAVPAVTRALATSHINWASGLETNTAAVTVPLVENANVPIFSSNGLPAFDRNTNRYFWRLSPSDDQNGAAYAVWAKLKKYRSAAVILQTNAGNDTVKPGIVRAFKKLGIKLTTEVDLPGDAASYASVVAKVLKGKPQAIVAATDPQTAATFFSQYKQLNHGKVPALVTATDSLTPDYFNALKKVLGAAYVTKQISLVGYHVDPNSAAFAAYKDGLTSSPNVPQAAVPVVTGIGVIASLYDGDIVAALAMNVAKSATGADWNKAVLSVTTPGKHKTIVHTYAAGVAAIKAGKQIDYVGTGGQIHFDKYHNSAGNFSATAFNADGSPHLLGVFGGDLVAQALK